MNQTRQLNLDIGSSEFDAVIQEKLFFIDKTMFIKKFIESNAFAQVISRPRRFGKSTNLSMLKSFLTLGANPEGFKPFKIYKQDQFVKEHCGRYPVIYLDLKLVNGKTFEQLFIKSEKYLKRMIERHRKELPLDDYLQLMDTCFLPKEASLFKRQSAASESIYLLAKILHETHKQKVIILVDEYDTPSNSTFQNNFFEDAASFFNDLFGSAFKGTCDIVKKICMMGIVEISGKGFLSGINDLKTTAIDDEYYAPYFGFTIDEIKEYVTDEQLKNVLEWYNGYWGGSKIQLINPWSFVMYLSARICRSYWIKTSSFGMLSLITHEHADKVIPALAHILSLFYLQVESEKGYKVEPLSTVHQDFKDQWSKTRILHFLVLSGYLSYQVSVDGTNGMVSIPNHEVFLHWKSEIQALVDGFYKKEQIFEYGLYYKIQQVFMQTIETLSTEKLLDLMEKLISLPSFHDLVSENSHHIFLFAIFLISLKQSDSILVNCNREQSLNVIFLSENKAICIKFNSSDSEKALNVDAKAALEEIKKNSLEEYSNFTRMYIGVSFCIKTIALKVVVVGPE